MLRKIQKHKYFIPVLILSGIILLSGLSLKTYFYIRFDESQIREIVTDVCKNNLNKAIKFDTISIGITGNLILEGVKLSLTPDFNDNLNSLVADNMVIDLDILKLFRGDFQVEGLSLDDPVINLTKQFGKDYGETFGRIFTLNRSSDKIDPAFEIDIENGTVNYTEIFSDSRLNAKIEELDASLLFKNNSMSYELEGDISPCKTPRIKEGHFCVEGHRDGENGNSGSMKMVNELTFDTIDISYANDYILSNDIADIAMNGGLSGSITITSAGDYRSISGKLETSNLHLLRHPGNPYPVISGGNIDLAFDADMVRSTSTYRIKKLEITDDELDLDIKGEYAGGQYPRLRLKLAPTSVDLDDLTAYITPFRDMHFTGDLSCSAEIDYNASPGSKQSVKADVSCTDLSITSFNGFSKNERIHSGNVELHLLTDSLNILCKLKSDKTDLSMKSTTSISSWAPFRSSTIVNGESASLDASVLGSIIRNVLDATFLEALNDSQMGYEERFFLARPAGQYINNNDITISYKADSLYFGNKAALTGFRMAADMKAGIVALTDFTLAGYGAAYSLTLNGELNRDYPHLAFSAKINGFDCTRFAQSLGEPGVGGTGDFDLTYDITFYRPSHIFENGHARIGMRLKDGFLHNTSFQKRLMAYLSHNGYNALNLSDIRFTNFSVDCNQSSDTFYVQPLNLSASGVSMNGNGRYTYVSGLEINVFLQAIDATGKGVSIPFSLEGDVLNPQLWLKTKNASGSLSLLDVN